MKQNKFDTVFKESYKLFSEGDEAPPIDNDEAPIEDGVPQGEPSMGDGESALPDVKEQETVTINLINIFIDFLNLPEEDRKEFLRDYDVLSDRADSSNYKEKLEAFKNITKSDFPMPTE